MGRHIEETHIQALTVQVIERLDHGAQQCRLAVQHVVGLIQDLHEGFVASEI